MSVELQAHATEMINWQDELKKYWCKVEDDTKSSLKLIKADLIRRGLLFDDTFKHYFQQSANARFGGAIEQFLVGEQFSNGNFFNTDTHQRDQANRASESGSDGRQSDYYGGAFSHRNQSTSHLSNTNQHQAMNTSSVVDTSNPKDVIDQSVAYPQPKNTPVSEIHSLNTHLIIETNQNTGQLHSTAIEQENMNETSFGTQAHLNDDQRISVVSPDADIKQNSPQNGGRMIDISLDYAQQQDFSDEPTRGQEIGSMQYSDTIDLTSDHEEDKSVTRNKSKIKSVQNVVNQSQPTIQHQYKRRRKFQEETKIDK